jgi:hypothetical protein
MLPLSDQLHFVCEGIRSNRDRLRMITEAGAFLHPDSMESVLIGKAIKEMQADLARLRKATPADLIRDVA